jgi:hypothetical protein
MKATIVARNNELPGFFQEGFAISLEKSEIRVLLESVGDEESIPFGDGFSETLTKLLSMKYQKMLTDLDESHRWFKRGQYAFIHVAPLSFLDDTVSGYIGVTTNNTQTIRAAHFTGELDAVWCLALDDEMRDVWREFESNGSSHLPYHYNRASYESLFPSQALLALDRVAIRPETLGAIGWLRGMPDDESSDDMAGTCRYIRRIWIEKLIAMRKRAHVVHGTNGAYIEHVDRPAYKPFKQMILDGLVARGLIDAADLTHA